MVQVLTTHVHHLRSADQHVAYSSRTRARSIRRPSGTELGVYISFQSQYLFHFLFQFASPFEFLSEQFRFRFPFQFQFQFLFWFMFEFPVLVNRGMAGDSKGPGRLLSKSPDSMGSFPFMSRWEVTHPASHEELWAVLRGMLPLS